MRASIFVATILLGLVVVGCGPGYSVLRQSGSLAGANPVGLAFDYSEASFRGGLSEAEWVAQRSPDELAAYSLVRDEWHASFARVLADQSGRDIVPATGSEPVVLTVTVQQFEIGRYMPFAHVSTRLDANMRFSRQGQITDEIGVRCERAPRAGSRGEQRMAECGRILAIPTSRFMNR